MKVLRLFAMCLALLSSHYANALPAFARQTGQACVACHVGGYGPQLTSFGIRFKLSGYTLSDGKEGKVPLSAMLVEGFTNTKKSLTEDAAPHFDRNNNLSTQELKVFLAGGLTKHLGVFVEAGGDDIDRKLTLGNIDARLTDNGEFAGKSVTYGIDVHNSPTGQDPFNTLTTWKFPYMESALAPTPAASTFIGGTLDEQVVGVSGYAFIDNNIYVELGGYKSLSKSLRNTLNLAEDGRISGLAPYARLAYFKDTDNGFFHVGLVGTQANLDPDFSHGKNDRYRDFGIDGSYQYHVGDHILSLSTSFMNEQRNFRKGFDSGEASHKNGHLTQFDLAGAYNYQNTYGITLGLFDTRGNKDDALYNNGEADSGSINGSPNSRGYRLQADWTPFGKQDSKYAPYANLRFGAQYVGYTKFNGAKNNYDGLGRDAKDNNTLFLFAWFAI